MQSLRVGVHCCVKGLGRRWYLPHWWVRQDVSWRDRCGVEQKPWHTCIPYRWTRVTTHTDKFEYIHDIEVRHHPPIHASRLVYRRVYFQGNDSRMTVTCPMCVIPGWDVGFWPKNLPRIIAISILLWRFCTDKCNIIKLNQVTSQDEEFLKMFICDFKPNLSYMFVK